MKAKFLSEERVDLLIPKPVYINYDKTGHLSIHGVWRIMADAFFEAENKGFLTTALSKLGYRLYKVRDKTVYSTKIHRKIFSANDGFLSSVSIDTFGTTSICICHQLLDPLTMEVLVHAECKSVNVDQNTQRPCNIPECITEKFSAFSSAKHSSRSVKQDMFVPPRSAFKSTIMTRHSDADYNGHLNSTEFYRLCADCASEASLSAYYRHFNDDLSWFPVLETDVTFLGESLPCIQHDVFTWQDSSNVQKIYFAVYIKDKVIFQACYLYDLNKSRMNMSKL